MSHNIKRGEEKNKQRGIIKYIFLLFIAILILSYFGFDLEKFMNSEMVVKNLTYVKGFVLDLWTSYGKPLYDWLFNLFGPSIYQTIDMLQNNGSIRDLYTAPQMPKINP